MKNINWFEHGQMCKKSRKRYRRTKKIKLHTTPDHARYIRRLKESAQTADTRYKIRDVPVLETQLETNPPILDTFQPKPENPPPLKTNPPKEHEEDEPWTHDNHIIADGTPRDSKVETARPQT